MTTDKFHGCNPEMFYTVIKILHILGKLCLRKLGSLSVKKEINSGWRYLHQCCVITCLLVFTHYFKSPHCCLSLFCFYYYRFSRHRPLCLQRLLSCLPKSVLESPKCHPRIWHRRDSQTAQMDREFQAGVTTAGRIRHTHYYSLYTVLYCSSILLNSECNKSCFKNMMWNKFRKNHNWTMNMQQTHGICLSHIPWSTQRRYRCQSRRVHGELRWGLSSCPTRIWQQQRWMPL